MKRFVEKFSEELQEDFIKLVHNTAMKGDLKSFPINLLWVHGNNGTNGKVGKNDTYFQYWGGGLEFEVDV